MAVIQGAKILQGDMAALADLANSVAGPTRLPKDVSPMNYSGGAKYGYRQIANVAVHPSYRGSGYQAGDFLQGFGGFLAVGVRVGAVDAAGGLLCIRIVDLYQFNATDTFPTSPQDATSAFGGAMTSGTGAKLSFSVDHIGPDADYAFAEFWINYGVINSIILLTAGRGYQVGDVLSVPSLPGLTITVNTVSSGAILTFSLTGTSGVLAVNREIPTDITALVLTGGTGIGAIFAGLVTLPQIPKWKTELERLRGSLSTYLTAMQTDASKLSISGPWPITGPAWSNHDQWFWFEDTGNAESVTVSAGFSGSSSGKFTTTPVNVVLTHVWLGDGWPNGHSPYSSDPNFNQPPWCGYHDPAAVSASVPRVTALDEGVNGYVDLGVGQFVPISGEGVSNYYDCLYATSKDFSIIIGGQDAVTINGVFCIILPILYGRTKSGHTYYDHTIPDWVSLQTNTVDAKNPADLVAVKPQTNFPGSFLKRVFHNGTNGDAVFLQWTVNGSISPGRYDVFLEFDTQGDDSNSSHEFTGTMIDSNPASLTYGMTIIDSLSYDWQWVSTTKTRLLGFTPSPSSIALVGASSITWGTPDGAGIYPAPTLSGQPVSISHVYTTAVSAAGIDLTKNIYKINLPDGAENAGSLPCGIYSVNALSVDPPDAVVTYQTGDNFRNGLPVNHSYYDHTNGNNSYLPSDAWNWTPFPQPFFNIEKILPGGSWGVSTSTTGFWTGITAAVSNLNVVTTDRMPWNFARTMAKYISAGNYSLYSENPMLLGNGNPDNIAAANSYDQGVPVEGQNEPASWAVKKWFTIGFVITDANGFGFFKCTVAGYSGAAQPNWNFTLGATTDETHDPPPTGGQSTWATWTCVNLFNPEDTWIASHTWSIGDTCVDSNGNTQTIVSGWKPFQLLTVGQFITDANSNTQQVLTAGTTAVTVPTWATALNATTNDGSVVWKLVIIGSSSVSGVVEPTWSQSFGDITQDAAAFWQMTGPAKNSRPALHRSRPIPRYPFYWQSETIAALKPPVTNAESEKTIWGCGNQWFKSGYYDAGGTVYEAGWQEKYEGGGNQAYGWWIYSVSINRIQKFARNLSGSGTIGAGDGSVGSGDGTVGAGGGGNNTPVAVTIGCIRNGSFVAFGTYVTGQTVQVLWPIFTSDALVYQCSERVDIQAVAIDFSVTTGLGGVNHPIAAAFFTDTATLLKLVQ